MSDASGVAEAMLGLPGFGGAGRAGGRQRDRHRDRNDRRAGRLPGLRRRGAGPRAHRRRLPRPGRLRGDVPSSVELRWRSGRNPTRPPGRRSPPGRCRRCDASNRPGAPASSNGRAAAATPWRPAEDVNLHGAGGSRNHCAGASSSGLLIHAAPGSSGGVGGFLTNRSGWAA